jgi:hypothetical protein
MAANPSIQLGTDGNWAIKEDNLLAYKKDGTRFFNKEFDFTRGSLATFVDKDGLVKVSGVTNTELVTNGNFDNNSDWSNFSTPTTSKQSTDKAYLGNYSWYIVASAFRQGIFSPNNFSLVSGKTYRASLWIYALDGAEILSGVSNSDASVFTSRTVAQGQWTNIVYYFRATASSSSYISILSSSSTLKFYVDNVSVKEIQTDVPRIDFTEDATGHLLLEPQSTNKLTYSEDFSSWTTTSATLTSNQSSPDGFNNAYIIEDDSASSYERVDETITTTAAPHTFSVFIKKKTSLVSSYSGIQMGTGFSYVIFDSYNGTYNQQSNTNYNSIEVKSFNSEWWRLKLTATVTTSTRVALWGAISVNGTSISTAAIGSETFFGAQLEEKSYATSYIPTSGSTVTRNAEVCNNSGSAQDFSEEGVLYAEFATFSKSYNFPTIQLSDGTSNNGVRIFPIGLGTNNIQVQVDSGGSISFVSTSTTINPTEYNKIAVKFKQDDFSFYINGTQKSTDNSGNAPVGLNKLDFLNNFYGKVRNVQVFKRALSDTELQKLTTQ